MMKISHLLGFLLTILLPSLLNAQSGLKRGCVANEVRDASWVAPFSAGSAAFEKWIEKAQATENEKSIQDNDALYYIPVVVHVIHFGESIGTDRNISASQIQSQLDILNNDYSKGVGTPGYNANPVGADTRIRFCLAAIDPNGQPTTGINRVNANRDGFNFTSDNLELKNMSFWDANKYLNLWTCKILGNQYIGYAQYPFITDSIQMPLPIPDVQPDGVVIDYRVFGDLAPVPPFPSYNKGRTTTHEVGHYLGLIHIWGDGFACADNATDFCADTPPQAYYTANCPATVNSCSTGVPAMFQNYMDYTNDACMNIFTYDQKRRMRIVLRNAPRRKTILTTPTQCGVSSTTAQFNQSLFALYPTVSTDFIFVEQKENESVAGMVVKDISGRSISLNYEAGNKLITIQTSDLKPGMYWIELKTESAKIWRGKFVKQ